MVKSKLKALFILIFALNILYITGQINALHDTPNDPDFPSERLLNYYNETTGARIGTRTSETSKLVNVNPSNSLSSFNYPCINEVTGARVGTGFCDTDPEHYSYYTQSQNIDYSDVEFVYFENSVDDPLGRIEGGSIGRFTLATAHADQDHDLNNDGVDDQFIEDSNTDNLGNHVWNTYNIFDTTKVKYYISIKEINEFGTSRYWGVNDFKNEANMYNEPIVRYTKINNAFYSDPASATHPVGEAIAQYVMTTAFQTLMQSNPYTKGALIAYELYNTFSSWIKDDKTGCNSDVCIDYGVTIPGTSEPAMRVTLSDRNVANVLQVVLEGMQAPLRGKIEVKTYWETTIKQQFLLVNLNGNPGSVQTYEHTISGSSAVFDLFHSEERTGEDWTGYGFKLDTPGPVSFTSVDNSRVTQSNNGENWYMAFGNKDRVYFQVSNSYPLVQNSKWYLDGTLIASGLQTALYQLTDAYSEVTLIVNIVNYQANLNKATSLGPLSTTVTWEQYENTNIVVKLYQVSSLTSTNTDNLKQTLSYSRSGTGSMTILTSSYTPPGGYFRAHVDILNTNNEVLISFWSNGQAINKPTSISASLSMPSSYMRMDLSWVQYGDYYVTVTLYRSSDSTVTTSDPVATSSSVTKTGSGSQSYQPMYYPSTTGYYKAYYKFYLSGQYITGGWFSGQIYYSASPPPCTTRCNYN